MYQIDMLQIILLLLSMGIPLRSLMKERSTVSRFRQLHNGNNSYWIIWFSLLMLVSAGILLVVEEILSVRTFWAAFLILGFVMFILSLILYSLEKRVAKFNFRVSEASKATRSVGKSKGKSK